MIDAYRHSPALGFSTIFNRHLIPAYVFWELTRQCNLNCNHCYVVKESRDELSFEAIVDIIKRLKDMNTLVLNFSGGEVFLRSDFFKIARLARKENFAIKIFTNGTLIGKSEARYLKALSPLAVEISLYSSVPEVHDKITGTPGSWQRSINALNALLDERIKARVKCSIMKENIHTFKKTLKFISSFNIKYQFNPIIMPKINGSNNPTRLSIGKEKLRTVIKVFPNEYKGEKTGEGKLNSPPCSAGITSCAINAYGDLLPCIALPVNIANLTEEDFKDAWLHNGFLIALRKAKIRDLQHCSNCKALDFCSRCPGIAFLKRGDYKLSYEEACAEAFIKEESYAYSTN